MDLGAALSRPARERRQARLGGRAGDAIATQRGDAEALAPVEVHGKFFFVGGPEILRQGRDLRPVRARPRTARSSPSTKRVTRDFALMRELGANTRPRLHRAAASGCWTTAAAAGLRVLVGIPWAQHVTFLDDSAVQREILRSDRRRGARPATGTRRSSPISSATRSRPTWCAGTAPSGCAHSCKRLVAMVKEADPGRARQLRQFSVDRIPHCRFHRFPVLQRLSARRARVPPLSLAAAQSRGRPPARADRVRHQFDPRGRGRSRRASCRGRSAPRSRWAPPAPSSSPGPTNGSPAAMRSRTGPSAWSIATRAPKPAFAAVAGALRGADPAAPAEDAARLGRGLRLQRRAHDGAVPRLARASELSRLRGDRRQ